MKTKNINSPFGTFYQEGYLKGSQDACIGLSPKLLCHLAELECPNLKIWEEGYIDGYFETLAKMRIAS